MKQFVRFIILLTVGSAGMSAGFAQPADCADGMNAFQAKNYEAAQAPLSRCLDLQIPPEPRSMILQMRAQSYAETKKFDLAIADQRLAISTLIPQDVWPYVMLGVYYRDAGRLDDSIDALQSAMKLDEDGPGTGPGMAVHYHMAQTFHAAKRYREAIEVMTKGVPKQPDYGYALYQRALAYEAIGDRDQAKRDLFRASELAPKDGYEPEIASKLMEYGFMVKIRSE
jgi:tetratricopeptide (TPR) repeat protein